MNADVLCSISTYRRYNTTLPLALMSVVQQTKLPDKLIVYDDNEDPEDVRENPIYKYIFHILDNKNVAWEWVFAGKKGQHHNHQLANKSGFKWVWRLDDDTVAESNVLETLLSYVDDNLGAVGGAVLTPPLTKKVNATGSIENIDVEPNIQWGEIDQIKEVDHLHCSFLYRANVHDYNLSLSRVAHREETLFTYGLKRKNYKLLVVPNARVWHLKNNEGGIRAKDIHKSEMFSHDEKIFRNSLEFLNKTIVVLDCGMGDHLMFKHILPEIKDPVIFSCYPDIVPGRSISEAKQILGDIQPYNIYAKMDQWNWKNSMVDAFRKLYCSKENI